METRSALAVAGLALLVGVAAGWTAGWLTARDDVDELERRLDALLERQDETRTLLAEAERRAQDRAAARGGRTRAESPAPPTALPPDAAATAVGDGSDGGAEGPDPLDAAERSSKVDAIRADLDVWFERGKGQRVLDALKELAALVPEGRDAAMELAIRLNEDVHGEGSLEVSMMTFYAALGDPAVKRLMASSLEDPSPPEFRVIAAHSLPWIQDPARTIAQFGAALPDETDVEVQQAMVWQLARMRKPDADAILSGVLGDSTRDASLRARVATELATNDNPEIRGLIQRAADEDPDERVRAASRAALLVRDPPATGYLVTGTLPDSQGEAAGLRAGDIVVSYAGRDTTTRQALRDATGSADGDEPVPLVVVRDGGTVTLHVRPGSLGVYGRAVEARRDE